MTVKETVLITDITSFIGKAVSDVLLKEGYIVYVLVSPDSTEAIPVGAQKIEQDFYYSPIPENISEINTIIHTAHMPYGPRLPHMRSARKALKSHCRKFNVEIPFRLAQKAAEVGVQRFVFLSSAQIMGSFQSTPYTDQDIPNPVEDENVLQKFECEQKLQEVAKKYTMTISSLRVPLVYGPHMSGRFIKLLQSIQKKVRFPFSHIQNQQSLLYVQNLADAIVALLKGQTKGFNAYLLADPTPISTPDVVRAFAEVLEMPNPIMIGSEKKLFFMFKLLGKKAALRRITESFVLDFSKFQKTFEWTPRCTTQEGLKALAKWYLNSQNNF